MSRNRLSWYKTADPYSMNQDHSQPSHEQYQAGDPSAWAEDVHPTLPDDEALGRNDVGHSNKASSTDYWDDDTSERTARSQKESARDVYAHLERKAFQCVKIADALLPGAPESLIEAQALDFMSLPDEAVVATAIRLAEEHAEEEEAKEEEADDEDVEAMLREMLSEAKEEKKEDEDEDEDEDASDEEEEKEEDADADEEDEEDAEVEAMLRDMLSEDKEDADEAEEEEEEDEEIEAMLQDMMNHGEPSASSTEMDIQLDPTMDTVSAGIDEDDTVLSNLFADTVPDEARNAAPQKQASGRKGVQTLGGRVKEATDSGGDDVNLSKLWQSDPDVSDIF